MIHKDDARALLRWAISASWHLLQPVDNRSVIEQMVRVAIAGLSYTESFIMRIVQWISTLLIIYVCIGFGYARTDNDCGLERFRCHNGECIADELLCDGREDCKDLSDETEVECKNILCPNHSFQCNYGGCINKDYVCNGNQDCVDNSDETQPQCRSTGRKNQTKRSTQIRCKALSTASVEAVCTYDDEWVSCESPVPPRTKATLACRNSYRRETSLLSSQRNNVRCNANGQWEPEPIRCVPVCGLLHVEQTPLIINDNRPNITEFPWHASMYRDIPGESKKYFCGASIIQENLLITAAHCVYDENTGRVVDANKIYIVTGNIFRDYDSPLHNPRLVKKNQVKNIYIYVTYFGFIGNYILDIAILELVEPFVLSASLIPVCIDTFSDRAVLEPGSYGKVAGFGRTAVGDSSAVLQALTVPYVPFDECKNASKNASTVQFIDKFCAGYMNGSSICDGDSGSGLVFKTNDLWYLRGITSIYPGTILDGGTARCDHNSYTLYTRISSHIEWIQLIIAKVEQNQTPLLRLDTTQSPPVLTPSPTRPTVTPDTKTCKALPQPRNGHWKLHRSQCPGGQECNVPEGTELGLGSHLIYSCNPGYKIRGPIDVSCSIEGNWLNIPVCTEIRCKALSTASVKAECTYDDEWVSCRSPVSPRTKAKLACQNNYRRSEYSVFSRGRSNVRCNANGQWEPEPIRCVPVCGTLPVEYTPLIINGSRPNITEFPWHASMYRDVPGEPKKYFCGASIIQENLLVTAAHCVYDEINERMIDANKIYIVTGNIYRDYNSPLHVSRLVKKNQVKNIYMECNYLGFSGNYDSDIAILELVEPFVLSSSLVPVCIDTFSDRAVLEPGSYGKVAGFGRTAVGDSSAVLQALTVPYVPFGECKNASKNASTVQLITTDKFCAGYTNGSSVCDGDSGSGLVFKTNDLWYLRGIVSVSLGTILDGGTTLCDHNLYTLYTQISSHVIWIKDIIARVEQNQMHSLCLDRF